MANDEITSYKPLTERLCKIITVLAANKVAKNTLFYDGIYFSIQMIRFIYNNLVNKLLTLSEFKAKDPNILAQSAISDAWSIVDSLYRLRKLLEDTPGLKQNLPPLKLFYQKTKGLKDLRDSIQHLDETIEKYVSYKIPALGRLFWICPVNNRRYKACMIVPGDFAPGWNLMPSRMGEKMRSPVDFISLATNNIVCLTHMIDALEQLMPWLNDQFNGYFNYKHQLVIVCAGINTNYDIL